MFSFYKNRVFYPWMTRSISTEEVMRLRADTVAAAAGDVLEIGYGTGLNLSLYPRDIHSLTGIDTPIPPSALKTANDLTPTLLDMSAEKLNFADASFDTVVSTFTLCSISNLQAALGEVYRVLKPGGRFHFLEHGKSWKKSAAIAQVLASPVFLLTGCGCRVTRDYPPLILSQGFTALQCKRIHLKSIPIAGYIYTGSAQKPG